MMNGFSSSLQSNLKWLLHRELKISTVEGQVTLGPKYSMLAKVLTERRPDIAQEYYGISFRDAVICQKCAEDVEKELDEYEKQTEKKLLFEKLDENSELRELPPKIDRVSHETGDAGEVPWKQSLYPSSALQRLKQVEPCTNRSLPGRELQKMTSLVNMSSQGSIQGRFAGQNSMESRKVRYHSDNRQFCPSTEQKGKEMDRFGRNAVLGKARPDNGKLINTENGVCFNSKPGKYLDESQCYISPDYLLMNASERRPRAEVSVSRNSYPQRSLLQKQNTPYFTALEQFSDWLYEWTPPERILPKLKMIGKMRNEVVQGWLLSVNIQRPLPLYEPENRETLDRKDASVQTDSNLHETPPKTKHKFTCVKKWLQNCFPRSQHSCRTTLCKGEGEMKGESQKNVDALKDNESGYATEGEKSSRQEAVTMATLKDLGYIDATERRSKISSFTDVLESRQNKVKIIEKSSDIIKYPATNTDFTEQDAQSTTTLAGKNLRNLREIDGTSLISVKEITKLRDDGVTDRKYWKGTKVNERISPRSVGTEAGDNIESDLKINQIDFQSKTASRLTTSSLSEEVEKIDDNIGRDKNESEKRKIYSTDVVRKITGKVNLSSENNKIISKIEKARCNLLNMSRSFRSKIQEMESPSFADKKVKATEIMSLPVGLVLESSDDASARNVCTQKRLRDANPAAKSYFRSSLRERLPVKICESNKVHPLKIHRERTINEMEAESPDKEELQGMTDFIEMMLQRDKTINPNMEIKGLLHRQKELNTRMRNSSTFLPCHRLELAFRETLTQKFAHHNHFRTAPLPKRPDSRQGCIGCQLVVASELYGNSQKFEKTKHEERTY